MDAAPALNQRHAGTGVKLRVTGFTLAVGLTLLAIALRLIGLGGRPLWLDEAYSWWFSARDLHYLWTVVPTYEPHPPFYYTLLKGWRAMFGASPVELRAFSVLLGAATVPAVIAAALELERQGPTERPYLAAGIAGFLAACSPMLVFLGQEARPYPLLIFAYAVALLGALRLFRELRCGPGAWSSWLLLAAGSELALWAHGLGLLYAVCLAVAVAPAWMASKRLARGITVAAAVALLYLPCLAMIATRSGDWGSGWLSWEPLMLLQLLGLYSVPFEIWTIAAAVSAVALLVLAKRALVFAVRASGWDAERALVLLWLGPALLAAVISAAVIPVFLPRTLAGTLIPFALLVGRALARTEGAPERRILGAALAITLLPSSVQIALRAPTEDWAGVRAYLAQHVGPGDAVWLYPNDSALPLDAAGPLPAGTRGIPGDYPAVGVSGPIRAGSPAVVSLSHDQAEKLATAIAPAGTVWLVTRQSALFDPRGDVPRALGRVRVAGPAQQWGYITVQPFYRR